jgi:hypothetical protein
MRTRLTGETERAALAAFQELAGGTPRRMCRARRLAIGGERPFDSVLGQSMLEYGAGMVEDDAIRFPFGRPQAATDHLPKQPHLFRGARERDAADVGQIEALGQHHAIGIRRNCKTFESR